MKNDKNIQKAIEQYCIMKGCSPKALGLLIGKPDTTVIRWKNGATDEIQNANWKLLFPLIKSYLPPERIQKTLTGNEEIYLSDSDLKAQSLKGKSLLYQENKEPSEDSSYEDILAMVNSISDEDKRKFAHSLYSKGLKELQDKIEAVKKM